MVKVFGHLNPDTDTTGSAIAYAWYLNQIGVAAEPFVLGDLNKETRYVLETFAIPVPALLKTLSEGDEVVLVDTNNPDELPETLSNTTVKEIVDHHKLAGLKTPEPLAITMKPVACTATIIYQKMQEKGLAIPAPVAGILVACILSDTLKFTSPTTTEEDKVAAQALTGLAGIDSETLASGMFAAKSNLEGMSARDILLSDSKVFTMGDKKIRVSSHETTDPRQALAMEAELISGIEDIKGQEELDGLFFFVVDILQSSSVLLQASAFEKEIAAKAFERSVDGSTLELPGVVSRKKQMVPPLERVIA